MSDWHHLLPFALAQAGDMALATLVRVEGSSYRPVGSRLLISSDGRYSGFLSGGCLEERVAEHAAEVLRTGERSMIQIDTRPHFGCAGVLHILLERISLTLVQEIASRLRQRATFDLISSLSSGTMIAKGYGPNTFTEAIKPTRRLIVIGWTDDTVPLLRIASILGWELHRVVRDAKIQEDIPSACGETIIPCPASEFISTFQPDDTTAVVIMSHHLVTDLAYLKETFNQPYAYIGLLGSKRRRETLLRELGECGLLEETPYLDRFHAPAGLAIGNDHPSEIALSIVTQVQQAFQRFSCLQGENNVVTLPRAISA